MISRKAIKSLSPSNLWTCFEERLKKKTQTEAFLTSQNESQFLPIAC